MEPLMNAATPLAQARATLASHYDLRFTPAVERETADVFARVKDRIPAVEWPFFAPLIVHINREKHERDAVILAHRYTSPQIFHGVADIAGDTVQLALAANNAPQSVIVQAGAFFMAETSKLLAPTKTVLMPDSRAGCSLAASITADDVRAMRAQYPGAAVVAHINTSAAVKAVSDACCTVANARAVVEAMPGETVILVPDQFLARNVARETSKKIITWAGSCEVHAPFTAEDIGELRAAYPGAAILVHPACRPEVLAAADFSGATSAMIDYLGSARPRRVVMVTECAVSDNVAAEFPQIEFLRGCNLCPHIKRITLENILWSLHTMSEEVSVPPEIAGPAARALGRMPELSGIG
jgi:quinolinate synthase